MWRHLLGDGNGGRVCAQVSEEELPTVLLKAALAPEALFKDGSAAALAASQIAAAGIQQAWNTDAICARGEHVRGAVPCAHPGCGRGSWSEC